MKSIVRTSIPKTCPFVSSFTVRFSSFARRTSLYFRFSAFDSQSCQNLRCMNLSTPLAICHYLVDPHEVSALLVSPVSSCGKSRQCEPSNLFSEQGSLFRAIIDPYAALKSPRILATSECLAFLSPSVITSKCCISTIKCCPPPCATIPAWVPAPLGPLAPSLPRASCACASSLTVAAAYINWCHAPLRCYTSIFHPCMYAVLLAAMANGKLQKLQGKGRVGVSDSWTHDPSLGVLFYLCT